jgi:golgin subfamily B member 1
LSTATLDERIRHHLETLEAAPGDKGAFEALETLYRNHGRLEEMLRLYEERARLVPEPGVAPELLEKAAKLARKELKDPERAASSTWR